MSMSCSILAGRTPPAALFVALAGSVSHTQLGVFLQLWLRLAGAIWALRSCALGPKATLYPDCGATQSARGMAG